MNSILMMLVLMPDAQAFTGTRPGELKEIAEIKFRWCPPGRFKIGSPTTEVGHRPDEAQVEVHLTSGYWIGQFEVTQGQWKRIVGPFPTPLTLGNGDDHPIHTVTYAQQEEFCQKLTDLTHRSGQIPKEWEIRLPTEAQWEQACRAGTTTATAFGDKLSSLQANFFGAPYNGAKEGPHLEGVVKVGSYSPNAWGIYDMHGNAAEWCRDWYHPTLLGGTNPDRYTQPGTSNRDGTRSRVRRGGGWDEDGWSCRSACRSRFEPERKYNHIGFRIVVTKK